MTFVKRFMTKDKGKRDIMGRAIIYMPLKVMLIIDSHTETPNASWVVKWDMHNRKLTKVYVNDRLVYDSDNAKQVSRVKEEYLNVSAARPKLDSQEAVRLKELAKVKGDLTLNALSVSKPGKSPKSVKF